jgi:hypothetical protein
VYAYLNRSAYATEAAAMSAARLGFMYAYGHLPDEVHVTPSVIVLGPIKPSALQLHMAHAQTVGLG